MSFFYLRFVTSGHSHTPIWLINATDGRSVSAILFFCRANLPQAAMISMLLSRKNPEKVSIAGTQASRR
jgi:hypothetical protein